MSEETIEELKAKLDALKKENLEREIASEKAKEDLAKKEEKEKEDEQLRDEIRNDLLKEFEGKSKVTEEPEKEVLNENTSKADEWLSMMEKKYNIKHESYEDLTRRVSSLGNFKGERK